MSPGKGREKDEAVFAKKKFSGLPLRKKGEPCGPGEGGTGFNLCRKRRTLVFWGNSQLRKEKRRCPFLYTPDFTSITSHGEGELARIEKGESCLKQGKYAPFSTSKKKDGRLSPLEGKNRPYFFQ